MQFLVIACDGTDENAPARRQAAREQHLAGAEKMYASKTLLYAAAILDEGGNMAGSMMVVDFPSRDAMQTNWLDNEPYILGDVWRDIRIEPCKTPGFIT